MIFPKQLTGLCCGCLKAKFGSNLDFLKVNQADEVVDKIINWFSNFTILLLFLIKFYGINNLFNCYSTFRS